MDRVTWGTNMEMGGLGDSAACRSGEAVTRYRRPWLPLDFGINQRPCPGGLQDPQPVLTAIYALCIYYMRRAWNAAGEVSSGNGS